MEYIERFILDPTDVIAPEPYEMAKSMLGTDVGDEVCWQQLWDVGD